VIIVEVVERNVEEFDQFRKIGLVVRIEVTVPDEKVERSRAACRLVVGREEPLHHLVDGHQLERVHLTVGVPRGEIRRQLQVVDELRVGE